MRYYCEGCGHVADDRKGRCPKCGTSVEASDVVNHVKIWDHLTDEAKKEYLSIIERGLEVKS